MTSLTQRPTLTKADLEEVLSSYLLPALGNKREQKAASKDIQNLSSYLPQYPGAVQNPGFPLNLLNMFSQVPNISYPYPSLYPNSSPEAPERSNTVQNTSKPLLDLSPPNLPRYKITPKLCQILDLPFSHTNPALNEYPGSYLFKEFTRYISEHELANGEYIDFSKDIEFKKLG